MGKKKDKSKIAKKMKKLNKKMMKLQKNTKLQKKMKNAGGEGTKEDRSDIPKLLRSAILLRAMFDVGCFPPNTPPRA
jgi:hypothetical protein